MPISRDDRVEACAAARRARCGSPNSMSSYVTCRTYVPHRIHGEYVFREVWCDNLGHERWEWRITSSRSLCQRPRVPEDTPIVEVQS